MENIRGGIALDDLNLICEVQKNPTLWDTRLAEYRNKKTREIRLLNIAKKLRRDVKDVEYRWRCLRSHYVRTKKGIGKECAEAGSSWPYFQYLQFLAPTIRHRRKIRSVNKVESDSKVITKNTAPVSILIEPSTSITPISTNEPCEDILEYEDTESYLESNGGKADLTTSSSDREENDDRAKLLNILLRTYQLLQEKVVKDENDDLQFFKSLLPSLSKLDGVEKLKFRKKCIENLIELQKNHEVA